MPPGWHQNQHPISTKASIANPFPLHFARITSKVESNDALLFFTFTSYYS
jgi:hypothetical protein